MIVKVQRSLATAPNNVQTFIVYDEDRSIMYQAPLTAAIARALGSRLKAYFHAEIDDEGILALDTVTEVAEQDW